ncbi:ecto-ADP-ribosyltransferase 3 isoform X2 [Saimiri boliviensis]|uniref:NAD(P)(+)--arginine ADP-ribosyltransferase n=2 Tax=Saimiri boliviensis TaxID=27679 RepID=A0A2K6TKU5_SAIBB
MKTRHFEIVTVLLAAMILVDIFQVKAEVLDMADNAFDDEYLKCTDRMEIKYVPQLLNEEKASHQQLDTVWENAKAKWEARKTQILLPMNFKDNHGIALLAYISEAQEQTPFYHLFNDAVKMAGQSREDYIYGFQFKAFHFYLTRALQLLRRPCKASYKNVVYRTSQGTSFTFGGLNQARFGHFTLAYSAKPQAANDQQTVLSIYTCLGVDIEIFLDKESERITLIPLNEVFQVSQEGAGNNLILQSTNKTCSHYECAFLGGLKTENCVENLEYFQHIYVYNPVTDSTDHFMGTSADSSKQTFSRHLEIPGKKKQKLEDHGEKNQKLEDHDGMKILEPTQVPGTKIPEPFPLPGIEVIQLNEKPEDKSQGNINNPTPGPVPVPSPKSHPSASSGKMLLPQFGTVILISVSAINLFVAL